MTFDDQTPRGDAPQYPAEDAEPVYQPQPPAYGTPHDGTPHYGAPDAAQPYAGQPYPAQPYPGQPYPAQPYAGQPYPGHPYPAQPYAGQPYPGQPYYGQYPGQPTAAQPPRTRTRAVVIGAVAAGLIGLSGLAALFATHSSSDPSPKQLCDTLSKGVVSGLGGRGTATVSVGGVAPSGFPTLPAGAAAGCTVDVKVTPVEEAGYVAAYTDTHKVDGYATALEMQGFTRMSQTFSIPGSQFFMGPGNRFVMIEQLAGKSAIALFTVVQ